MARLRSSAVAGLRQRLIDDLITAHGRSGGDDYEWLPGLSWGHEAEVGRLRAGGPVELYEFNLPREVRREHGFPPCSRVLLTGDSTLTAIR